MGKTSEGPPEVSFSDENSCTVRKKVAYVLAFLAVASCIVVGLLTYYVGVMGTLECSTQSGQYLTPEQSSTGSKSAHKKTKVSKFLKYPFSRHIIYGLSKRRTMG